ncbi:hypothetical protein TKK_0013979 [Trichogramma kaykai]|uniref:Uncharacterized protein n=1 Tax=Trichogramma kaykai TaxID=54128 RepID=A0ABD2WEY6_9HYME
MFSRLFLIVCGLALFNVVFAQDAAKKPEAEETDDRNPVAAAIVSRALTQIFVGAARKCLGEAVRACQQHSRNIGNALRCGRDFLRNNRGRCAVGK